MNVPLSSALAVFLTASTILASNAEGQRPRYTLLRLEALETAAGVLDQIRAVDMNNRGQVVGRAHNGRSSDKWASAAFLFTPGEGMRDLDPDGSYLSEAEAVNDRSQVFGRFGTSKFGHPGQAGIFLYRPGDGYDFLGSNRQIRTTFEFRDMNVGGELVGGVYSERRERWTPYLYSPTEGWIHLVPVHPRLGKSDLFAWYVNDHGEIAFSSRYGGCGDPGWFFLDRHGSFVGVGHLCADRYHGFPVSLRRFSKTGQMISAEYVFNGRRSLRFARYYKPGRGKVDIHPAGFKASGSDLITARGLIAGTLQEGQARDTVFTYDERRDPKLRVEITAEDFRAFAGRGFVKVILFDANDDGELIGFVDGPDEWFYHSLETGLLRVRDLFAEAGAEEDLMVVRQLNDRGQILVLAALDGLSAPRPREWFQLDAPNRRDMITYVMSPLANAGGSP